MTVEIFFFFNREQEFIKRNQKKSLESKTPIHKIKNPVDGLVANCW